MLLKDSSMYKPAVIEKKKKGAKDSTNISVNMQKAIRFE